MVLHDSTKPDLFYILFREQQNIRNIQHLFVFDRTKGYFEMKNLPQADEADYEFIRSPNGGNSGGISRPSARRYDLDR